MLGGEAKKKQKGNFMHIKSYAYPEDDFREVSLKKNSRTPIW